VFNSSFVKPRPHKKVFAALGTCRGIADGHGDRWVISIKRGPMEEHHGTAKAVLGWGKGHENGVRCRYEARLNRKRKTEGEGREGIETRAKRYMLVLDDAFNPPPTPWSEQQNAD